jgi:hypothetical protein
MVWDSKGLEATAWAQTGSYGMSPFRANILAFADPPWGCVGDSSPEICPAAFGVHRLTAARHSVAGSSEPLCAPTLLI